MKRQRNPKGHELIKMSHQAGANGGEDVQLVNI